MEADMSKNQLLGCVADDFTGASDAASCSFCLCFLQRFPQSWQYLRTSSPAVWN